MVLMGVVLLQPAMTRASTVKMSANQKRSMSIRESGYLATTIFLTSTWPFISSRAK